MMSSVTVACTVKIAVGRDSTVRRATQNRFLVTFVFARLQFQLFADVAAHRIQRRENDQRDQAEREQADRQRLLFTTPAAAPPRHADASSERAVNLVAARGQRGCGFTSSIRRDRRK